MDEPSWTTCDNTLAMLAFLAGKRSERKLRLFASACCRRVFHLMKDERSKRALTFAERLPDGGAGARRGRNAVAAEAKAAAMEATVAAESTLDPGEHLARLAESCAAWAAFFAVLADARRSVDESSGHAALALAYASCNPPPVLTPFPPDREPRMREEMRVQVEILREVAGDPFRPPSLASTALTPAVVSLAQAAYDERIMPIGELDPQRLAVLADALEEAGAGDDLLGHLRSPGPHVRGCWVVDLVLGKV